MQIDFLLMKFTGHKCLVLGNFEYFFFVPTYYTKTKHDKTRKQTQAFLGLHLFIFENTKTKHEKTFQNFWATSGLRGCQF